MNQNQCSATNTERKNGPVFSLSIGRTALVFKRCFLWKYGTSIESIWVFMENVGFYFEQILLMPAEREERRAPHRVKYARKKCTASGSKRSPVLKKKKNHFLGSLILSIFGSWDNQQVAGGAIWNWTHWSASKLVKKSKFDWKCWFLVIFGGLWILGDWRNFIFFGFGVISFCFVIFVGRSGNFGGRLRGWCGGLQ